MMTFAFKNCYHLIHKVINVKQFQFYAGVIYRIRQVVGKGVAESCHRAIVVGAAPFAKEVREAVNVYLGTGLPAILQKEIFACLLATAVFAVAKSASETGLLAAGKHYWTGVMMLLERIKKSAGKAKVALHKLFLVLRAVHTCQIEHKVGILAVFIQLLGRTVQVVLVHVLNGQARVGLVLASLYVFESPAKVLSNEPLGSCNENLHIIRDWEFRSTRSGYK